MSVMEARRFSRLHRVASGLPEGPILLATVLVFAISPLLAAGSVSTSALLGMLPFAAILAIAAVGQTLVVQQGGIDLSVPGAVSLGAVATGVYAGGSTDKLWQGLIVGLLLVGLGGLLNGVVVVYLRVTPIVTTLAMNALLIGVVLYISKGSAAQQMPASLSSFALGKFLGVPNTVLVAALLIAAGLFVNLKSILGRRFVAVGLSPAAARSAGVKVDSYRIGAYVAASICYAVAGVLLGAYVGTSTLFAGDQYLLLTIAAVVIGGSSLTGGRGAILGSALGALFLTQLQQIASAMGAPASVQLMTQGVVIAIAAAVWKGRT